MKRLILVSGSSTLTLSKQISTFLNISLVDPQITRFANGEVYFQISKNVRGADVFVIQSICAPGINDVLMELLIILDALKRASAASIVAVIPHYGYSCQDRKVNPRTPISAKLVADLLTVAGATRVITMDLHTGQIQGFFNIPFDNIYSAPVILDYLKKISLTNPICVSPDAGGTERARHYAKKLNCDIAMIDKRRTAANVAIAMSVVGNVKDKDCIIVDDIIDTAGTLIEAVKTLKEKGARNVIVCATHPVFSGKAFERIKACEDLTEVIVTDTIPLSSQWGTLSKVKVVSIGEILGKVIRYTFEDDSVSSLFV